MPHSSDPPYAVPVDSLMDRVPESAWVLHNYPADRPDEIEARSRNLGVFGIGLMTGCAAVLLPLPLAAISERLPYALMLVCNQLEFTAPLVCYTWLVICIVTCSENPFFKYINLIIYFLPATMIAIAFGQASTVTVTQLFRYAQVHPLHLAAYNTLPNPLVILPLYTLGIITFVIGLRTAGMIFPSDFQFEPSNDRKSDIALLLKLTAASAFLFAIIPLVTKIAVYNELRPIEFVCLAAFTACNMCFAAFTMVNVRRRKILSNASIGLLLLQGVIVAFAVIPKIALGIGIGYGATTEGFISGWFTGIISGYLCWFCTSEICIRWLRACGWSATEFLAAPNTKKPTSVTTD